MEIELFFERRLAKLLESGVRAELAADPELCVLPQFAHTPDEADATIVRYANDMTEAIRATTRRFNHPYFVSFSAPTNPRDRQDGLLSQWRGYGKDGGYALVFDAGHLEERLMIEARDYWYQHAHWGDVHYHQDDDDLVSAEPEITEAEEALRQAIRAYIRNPVAHELESTFEPVATLSCLYKHWGFHEEREVRIVAIPPNADLIREGRAAGEERPVRKIQTFTRGGTPIPYLDLFAHGQVEAPHEKPLLPITEVIVGPHPQSQLRRKAVEGILQAKGMAATVVISQIPVLAASSW